MRFHTLPASEDVSPHIGNRESPQLINTTFYARPALDVASELIGKILVRRVESTAFRARIVETEAYIGVHDLASHAAKGRTRRTEVMFGPAGRAYVYLIYGMYEMFNIVTSAIDDPQAVLIRAAEPLDGWPADLSGPGKLCRALNITRAVNGLELTGPDLFLMDDFTPRPTVVATPRIGVDYAAEWKHALLRFVDPTSRCLSSRKGLDPAHFPRKQGSRRSTAKDDLR